MTSRRVLITGANRGIGRALALGLAGRGWAVGLLARNGQALDDVAAQCRARGADAAVAAADVVDAAAVESAVGQLVSALGGIDLLVNNAGVIESDDADLVATGLDETWRVIEINVRGPLAVTSSVLRHTVLRAGESAGMLRIVNLNSGAGHKAMTGYTGYTVSKGALARLTTQLDAQYRDRGVRAFDVAPGHVETEMTRSMPMHEGRTSWTDPDDVVELVEAAGDGRLDELAGRFFRAGTDTPATLLSAAEEIVARNARVLRLAPIGDDDPVT